VVRLLVVHKHTKSYERSVGDLVAVHNDGSIVADGAEVLTNRNPYKTILPPIGPPGVPDVPVGAGGAIVVVAGQLHAVIDVVTAGGQDASLVVLPAGSIDADGDGATR